MAESQDRFSARLEQEIANLSKQVIERIQRLLEGQSQSSTAAPVQDVRHFDTGMVVRMRSPKLLGWENLGIFIRRF